jgi:hypothetical protein
MDEATSKGQIFSVGLSNLDHFNWYTFPMKDNKTLYISKVYEIKDKKQIVWSCDFYE